MANETLGLNKKAAGETVSVACKLPSGLQLRVFRMVDRDEQILGGGVRQVKQAEQLEPVYTVYGWAHPQNAGPHCTILHGYAITDGIPKEHWELWLSQNKNSMMVQNGLIFAQNSTSSIKDQAKDGKAVKSGLERLDPNNLPKIGKPIETSDMMDKGVLGRLAA
jgi:hypothetical protein